MKSKRAIAKADERSTERRLEIVYRKVAELLPYARNARTHSDEQVQEIVASIVEFGWTNPILLDGSNGIIAGHGRLQAAVALDREEVPTIDLVGLSDAQKRAYILADNKIPEHAGWNPALLSIELSAIAAEGFDLNLTGFSGTEIASLFGSSGPESEHWKGMPEFKQEDKTAFRSLVIHFKDQDAVDRFAKLIDQNVTEKTRFAWFPKIEIETYADKRYAAEVA